MQDPCTVSVLAWDPGADQAARTEGVVRAVGMDPFLAQQMVRRGTPLVVGRVPRDESGVATAALEAVGGRVLVVSVADVERLPRPVLAKRLETVGGSAGVYRVEAWRSATVGRVDDEGAVLDCGAAVLIVRAKVVSRRLGRPEADDAGERSVFSPQMGREMSALSALMGDGRGPRPVSIKASHVIDIWTAGRDGAGRIVPATIGRVRINGDRFNWDLLAHERGYGDGPNADRLGLMLAEKAVGAQVDVGFEAFAAINGRMLSGGSTMLPGGAEKRDQGPLMDFYSAWSMVRLVKGM